jgi:hypothetical protein
LTSFLVTCGVTPGRFASIGFASWTVPTASARLREFGSLSALPRVHRPSSTSEEPPRLTARSQHLAVREPLPFRPPSGYAYACTSAPGNGHLRWQSDVHVCRRRFRRRGGASVLCLIRGDLDVSIHAMPNDLQRVLPHEFRACRRQLTCVG